MNISARDVCLPVVPMFHANAWGIAYTAPMVGAALVLPGPRLDAESVLDLLADERVTLTAGVPTVWMAMLQAINTEPDRWDLSSLHRLLVGGSAVPKSMIEGYDKHGLQIVQGWGMTETSPLASTSILPAELDDASPEEQFDYRARQGTPAPYVEIRARGDDGELIPWDDQALGELEVRGPWVARAYHGGTGNEKFTDDGWFQTGDVVKIDSRGSIRISDRSKDLVKSGGEWISSVDLENLLMAHPAVAEAAVIAIPDEKWGERPLAAVVLCEGEEATPDELREHLCSQFSKWQLPERFEFIDEIPRTATGKFKKIELRERFVRGHCCWNRCAASVPRAGATPRARAGFGTIHMGRVGRTVLAVLVLTAAVLAGAGAAAAAPRSLSLRATADPITAGAAVTLTGRLKAPNHGGVTVTLWQELPGQRHFTRVTDTVTGPAGGYRIALPAGAVVVNSTWYATARALRSPTIVEGVRSLVKLTSTATYAVAGDREVLSATVSPNHAGQQVTPAAPRRRSLADRRAAAAPA